MFSPCLWFSSRRLGFWNDAIRCSPLLLGMKVCVHGALGKTGIPSECFQDSIDSGSTSKWLLKVNVFRARRFHDSWKDQIIDQGMSCIPGSATLEKTVELILITIVFCPLLQCHVTELINAQTTHLVRPSFQANFIIPSVRSGMPFQPWVSSCTRDSAMNLLKAISGEAEQELDLDAVDLCSSSHV